MATKNYTTKTAALKATIADVNKIETKKLKVNGKDVILNAKHAKDTRETITENDLWGQYIETKSDGTIIIHDDWVTKPNWNISITEVENNKAYIDGELYANIQTEKIKYGYNLFYGGYNLKSFYSDLSSLTNGDSMFDECTSLKDFNSDLSSLTYGYQMFYNTDIAEWNTDLPSLRDGYSMFYFGGLLTNAAVAKGLITFDAKMPLLTIGCNMFNGCNNLTSFSSNLHSLTDGTDMFSSCYNLKSFSSELPSLTNGQSMFSGCSSLTSFTSDLSSLTDGYRMFGGCTALATFASNLSSLMNGYNMFSSCKLDATSVANIVHFIPQRDAKPNSTIGIGNIGIGIGIANTDAEKQAFAEECFCDSWQDLLNEFDAKNWNVQIQCNGSATTYSLRQPSTVVYTKLEEVFLPTEQEIQLAKENNESIVIPHYEYVSQDGDNFYNIHWYHDSNTNNEGYDCFESLEMATLSYGVIPKE